MASLIISTNPDGSVSIAAPQQPIPPELMQDAQTASSLDEALKMAGEVLTDDASQPEQGEMGEGEGGGAPAPGGNQAETPPDQTTPAEGSEGKSRGQQLMEVMDPMQQGYDRAKKGH